MLACNRCASAAPSFHRARYVCTDICSHCFCLCVQQDFVACLESHCNACSQLARTRLSRLSPRGSASMMQYLGVRPLLHNVFKIQGSVILPCKHSPLSVWTGFTTVIGSDLSLSNPCSARAVGRMFTFLKSRLTRICPLKCPFM